MAKTKRANPSPVDEGVYDGTFTYTDLNDKNVKVRYRGHISLQEMGSCIHGIVNNIIDDEFGYFPYLYDISFSSGLLEHFTDFDMNVGTEELVETLNKTNLQDELDKCISAYQFEAILASVSEMIEFKKQKLITNSEIDNMWIAGKDLILKVSAIVDSLDIETTKKAIENLSKMDMSNITEKGIMSAMLEFAGVGKGKNDKPKKPSGGKKSKKNNVVELPIQGQQTFEDGEIES